MLRASLLLLLAATAARAETFATHGRSAADYQKWIDALPKTARPVSLSVHSLNGAPVFSAVARSNPFGQRWAARHDLTSAAYQKAFDEQAKAGLRVVCAAPYLVGAELRYAAIWAKDDEVSGGATHDQTAAGYQTRVDEALKQGLRPLFVAAHPTPAGTRFVAGLEGGDDDWFARHGLTSDALNKVIADAAKTKHFPAWATGYRDGTATRFAVTMVRDGTRDWKMHHGLTAAQYQKAFDEMAKAGWDLLHVSGYEDGGSRYLGVWVKERALPVSGDAVPALAAFDAAMRRFLGEHGIRAGSLAVSYQGRLVFSRGYGWAARDGSRFVQPATHFRMASIGKPITAALIRRLAAQGKLKLDDKAFSLLGLAPPANGDARVADITVAQLLDHRGGWDRAKGPNFDVMFQQKKIADALGIKTPVAAKDVVRWVATQPLQFEPGKKSVYSNFGYCLLGRVIEKVTGDTYEKASQKGVMAPLGAPTYRLGRTSPAARGGEPFYAARTSRPNLLTGKGYVAEQDGGFYLESLDAHGGMVASSADLTRFLEAYALDGRPRAKGAKADATFFGSLPGTHTLVRQLPSGVCYSALFNQRFSRDGGDLNAIKDRLDAAAALVKAWP